MQLKKRKMISIDQKMHIMTTKNSVFDSPFSAFLFDSDKNSNRKEEKKKRCNFLLRNKIKYEIFLSKHTLSIWIGVLISI